MFALCKLIQESIKDKNKHFLGKIIQSVISQSVHFTHFQFALHCSVHYLVNPQGGVALSNQTMYSTASTHHFILRGLNMRERIYFIKIFHNKAMIKNLGQDNFCININKGHFRLRLLKRLCTQKHSSIAELNVTMLKADILSAASLLCSSSTCSTCFFQLLSCFIFASHPGYKINLYNFVSLPARMEHLPAKQF